MRCFRGSFLVSLLVPLLAACAGHEPDTPGGAAPPPPETPSATAPPPTGPALFEDVAAAAGLEFHHVNGRTGEYYFSEMMGSGAALFDYDNDGDLDAYLVQGGPLSLSEGVTGPGDRLFRNDGGGGEPRFTDVTAAAGIDARGYGMGVATGDYDGDGFTDLYLTNFGPNQLWRNNGDGTFTDVTAESGTGEARWSVPALFFDYDGDGHLDLFVGNYVDFTLATHKPCTSDLGGPNYCGPLSYNPEPDTLYRNRGDGTFEEISRRAGLLGSGLGGALGAISADFDGDGRLDLYVGNDGLPNHLWINRGDGTFRDEALLAGCAVNQEGQPEASMGVDAADFDGDGDEDLFMTHLTAETNTLYVNQGRGLFEDRSAASGLAAPSLEATGFGTAFFDYDNDGRLDVLAVHGAVKVIPALVMAGDPFPLHQPNQLFRGREDGTFADVTATAGPAFRLSEVSRGAAFGDVDNDGDTDVLISNNGGPARLLVNRVGQDRPWLGLRLLERGGGDALGAWVGIFPAQGPPLWRRVRTAGSYASASDPRLLFGLGTAAGPARVLVRWPDGTREEWTEIPAGRYTTLRRGTGRAVEGAR